MLVLAGIMETESTTMLLFPIVYTSITDREVSHSDPEIVAADT